MDIAFGPSRVAVEVLGCFWHGCPLHHRSPASNSDYWTGKLERNKARDRENARQLAAAGWYLIVVWEHENPDAATERIAKVVQERRP